MKDAHIVLTALLLASGLSTSAWAITLEQAVGLGLKTLPESADQERVSPGLSGPKEVAYVGGKSVAPQEVGRRLAAAAQLKNRQLRENTALEVAEVYFDLLMVHYEVAAAQKQVALHEEALEANRNSAEEDPIQQRLEVARAELRSSLEKRERVRPVFLKQVGAEPGQMEIPAVVAMLQQPIIQLDTESNFGYLAAREELAACELEVEAAKRKWRPHLNVEAKGRGPGAAEAPGNARDLPSVSELMVREEASLAKSLQLRADANQQATEALETYSRAASLVQQRAASSVEILELANQLEAAHLAGKRSVLELLEVRNAQFRAETAFAESHIEQRRNAYRLLAATGQLVAHLDIPETPVVETPPQVIAAAELTPAAPAEEMMAEGGNGEIIAIVEPATATEVLSIGVAPLHLAPVFRPEEAEREQLDGVRRIGSHIVAMVEPAVAHPPTDLLPVSRDVTRRKREPKEVERERKWPFQKVFNMLKHK